jgi:hypothetical protein
MYRSPSTTAPQRDSSTASAQKQAIQKKHISTAPLQQSSKAAHQHSTVPIHSSTAAMNINT